MGRTSTRRRRSAEPETLRERLVELALSSPKDTLAVLVATAAVAVILINVLFLQKGRHPSPMFEAVPNLVSTRTAPAPRQRPAEDVARAPQKAVDSIAARIENVPQPVPRPSASVANAKPDPLADLIVANRRILAAQKALSEFGFGQIKPDGVAGPETRIAVERFERERRLPVTGQLSDRVLREIAIVTGRTIE
jgi:hypothetical protein